MKILTYIGLVVGLAVVVILVAWQGVGSVATILASLGWPGSPTCSLLPALGRCCSFRAMVRASR
jgi:hypothetical protein